MEVCGIIAEYNPFHNGHALHMNSARAGCDFVVCVMSGSFTQRGEPALFDKWTRARMALLCGADVVFELPALFATRASDDFAFGGVSCLGALNAVSTLAFGSETAEISTLLSMEALLFEESPEMTRLIREGLSRGESHARARGAALAQTLQISEASVGAPNTALALSYLRAIRVFGAGLRPMPIPRTNAYHSMEIGEIASAGAIRAALSRGETAAAVRAMPPPSAALLKARYPEEAADARALDPLLLYALRQMSEASLRALPDVSEGLEMRVLKFLPEAVSRENLIDQIKCKRYTRARISRMLLHALLKMDQNLCARYEKGAPYARVLGFRERARPFLKKIRRTSDIPVVMSPKTLRGEPCFELERRATDLWGLCAQNPALRKAGRDLTEPMIVLP